MTSKKLQDFVTNTPDVNAQDAIYKADRHLKEFEKIACSISGGSDSDIMLDLLAKLDEEKKVVYIWIDTGLEYEATKRHLKELEEKYSIKIIPLKAKKPIPTAVREYGVPFFSKQVSEFIERLQKHGFKWEDRPLDELMKEYPNCKSALRWWCNDCPEKISKTGEILKSKFNINYIRGLKEFMIENPPTFKISNKCCHYAKKAVASDFVKNGDFEVNCVGVRKAEGGARATAYKNCFTPSTFGEAAQYRPLFWFDDNSKRIYKEAHGVKYSDCYEVWGMERTGCAACPFGKRFEFELECIEKYEPKFYKAVNSIFGDSYEYTRRFYEFRKQLKRENE